jgi:hypothetical protein
MSNRNFPWKRFWVPRDGLYALDAWGALADPDSLYGREVNRSVVTLESLADWPCLVLLGEPGMGKSTVIAGHAANLTKGLRAPSEETVIYDLGSYQTDMLLVGDVFRGERIRTWQGGTATLRMFLDSLDECLIAIENLASLVEREIGRLPPDRLRLRLACRTAEWPKPLEDFLRGHWGDSAVGVYELAPLRKEDIEVAATQIRIDPTDFLSEIEKREASPLAIKPVTLQFLLNCFSKSKSFPTTQEELYHRGCLLLCEETKYGRRRRSQRRGDLDAPRKLAIASRIAAVLEFCRLSTIRTDVDMGDLGTDELAIETLATGTEEAVGKRFAVTENAIGQVLDTGLFSSRGLNRLGFAHKTYAEFLAASFVKKRHMSVPQVLSLTLHPEDSNKRVVPQLHETVAWIAGMIPEVMRHVIRSEPQVLLRGDISRTDVNYRQTLVAALLRSIEEGRISDLDSDISAYYRKLSHPHLQDQLKPFIIDRTKEIMVRRVAMEIAVACEMKGIAGILGDLALERTEVYEVRCQAAHALTRIGEKATKRRLRPLLFGKHEDDPDDDLKGLALRALWPEQLSIEQVLPVLTRPKRDHYGTYSSFLIDGFASGLQPEDFPRVLKWAASLKVTRESDYGLHTAVDAVMRKASRHLTDRRILRGFAQVAAARIKALDAILGRGWYQQELLGRDEVQARRRIIAATLPHLADEQHSPGLLSFSQPRLVYPDDFSWMIEQLRVTRGRQLKAAWSRLIRRCFDVGSAEHVDAVLSQCQRQPELAAEFQDLLGSIELESERAKLLRERYQEEIEWQRCRKSTSTTPSPAERIRTLLDAFEQGDLGAWWKLNFEMFRDPEDSAFSDMLESDLTVSPGWKNASEETKIRLVLAASKYIVGFTTVDHGWIFENRTNWPAMAGYRALRLLQTQRLDLLKELGADTWRVWAPVVLGYPTSTGGPGDDPHSLLCELAYESAPSQVLRILSAKLDKENSETGAVFTHRKLSRCWDDRISALLLEKVMSDSVGEWAMTELLEVLLSRGVATAKEFCVSLVARTHSRHGKQRTRALLAATALIGHSDDGAWPRIWPIIRRRRSFADTLVGSLASLHDHARFIPKIGEEAATDFYIWLVYKYPFEEDPRIDGFHQMSSREQVASLRDSVLRQLQFMGTMQSVKAVQRIANEFPRLTWMKSVVAKAAEVTLRRTWVPPSPTALLKLARDANTRRVESGQQLLDVVIESLMRLECEVQGETPGGVDLWNEVEKDSFRPKNENDLSNYLTRHL